MSDKKSLVDLMMEKIEQDKEPPIKEPKIPKPKVIPKEEIEYDPLKFGIRFWSFVARNMSIKNYRIMNLKQLKTAISEKLLKTK